MDQYQQRMKQSEVDLVVELLSDLTAQKAAGIEVEVATHVAPDADAILGAALSDIALRGARIVWQSSDEAVGSEKPQRMGIDVRAGARSVKGRGSSAAEIVARAMQRLGWHFDEAAQAMVKEVTAIDSAKGGRRAEFNLGRQVQYLRAAGWSGCQLVELVRNALCGHLTPPSTEVIE